MKQSPKIRYLGDMIDKFNRGCSFYQQAINARQMGNFSGYEKALLKVAPLVFGVLEEALRTYLRNLASIRAKERSQLQHPTFHNLITLMDQYADPPLEPETINLLLDYSDVRNAAKLKAAAPSIQYLGDAILVIRQVLLIYLPVEEDQLHQVQETISPDDYQPGTPDSSTIPSGQAEARDTGLIGKQLGSYQVVDQVGKGGMATVYKAYEPPPMDRHVALKIMRQHFANDPDYIKRFKQEVGVLAKLQHPHILPIHNYGEVEGYTFIVMPFIKSGTLAMLLRGTPLPIREIRHIIAQVGSALDYAHAHGLIHRDVKPENVLLGESGNYLLADFGIVKIAEETAKITQTGGIIGTPAYMSPEQGQGRKLNGQSDIYSLGVMLYQMATGQLPFTDTSSIGMIRKHQLEVPSPPRRLNPALSEALEQIILKSLAKQPEDRYATAGDMARALQAVPEDDLGGTPTEPADKITTSISEPDKPTPIPPDQLIDTITSHLRHGWVTDPWHNENPYNFLENLFIGPRSSMSQIQDYASAHMTEPQRIAWQQLRDLSSRLFVDSFLYRAGQSRDLISTVKEHLSVDNRLPAMEQIPLALQNEWPLILLLAGQREDALAAWAEIRQTHREQTDPTVIHSLAVGYTFLAQRQEQTGQIDTAITSWRKAITNWAWVLANDDFWTNWVSRRAKRYQIRDTSQHIANLQQQLRAYFSSRFIEESRALPPDCPAETQQAYEELSLEWRIEWAGLQALKRLQGAFLDSQMIKPVVGPLLVPVFGLEESLAQFTLECARAVEDVVFLLTSSMDADQVRQNIQDVRLYYSQLGRAAAWLDCLQPERTLAAMPSAEKISDFDQLNTPHRLFPDKETVWEKDRVALAMRAHLQLASTHLQREPWPIEAIVTQWTEIFSLGVSVDDTDLAIKMIDDQALAYLQPIAGNESGQHQQLLLAEATKQLIDLTPRLEAVLKELRSALRPGEPDGDSSSQTIVDLEAILASRGERQKQMTAPWQRQAEQWYAVLRVNPTDEKAREQLAEILVKQLEQLIDEEQIETARQIADEWYLKLDRHPRLQPLYRYLKHGYKVALYLPQTEMTYHTSLVESHTYHFGFQLEYTSFFSELRVEGDLVRISAPLPNFAGFPGADIQRNLLQVTWGMPLWKVYREPGGEYGLLIETLANALTPELLEELVRSQASRVDLSSAHLESLSALQQVMDTYAPDLSLRAGEPPADPDFERWQSQLLAQCHRLGLECTVGDFVYQLKHRAAQGKTIELDFQAPVVTFQARLAGQDRLGQNLYQRMMDWNRSARLCKLALDPDKTVVLRCEVLDLGDEETLVQVLTLAFEGLDRAEALFF